jgi:uncharacterized protein YcfJ
MKKKTLVAASLAAALAGATGAAQAGTYGDTARVVSATPVRQRIEVPRQECRVEQVAMVEERRTVSGDRPSGAGAVLGAIVGGVIGHQFGNSTAGRDHGTAAGAVVGGLVGNSIERDRVAEGTETYVDRTPVTRDVERCRTVMDSQERVVAYDVRYEYNGREFDTRLAYDPGPQMPVNVEVRPPAAPLPNYRPY